MSNLVQNNKIFRNTFFLIIIAELLSFLGYYYSSVNLSAFFIIVILTLIFALAKLKYGIFILLTELFIGSFGYLFYFKNGGLIISLRIALWLIIMSVWLAKVVVAWVRTKKLTLDFSKSRQFAPAIVLLFFIGWGAVNGFLNGNSLSNMFFDFNNWLYFLLIFPLYSVLRDESNFKIIKHIFLASITWLSLKTIFLVYIFTHNFHGLDSEIYGWMRTDRLGEITQTTAGFSRIFMQSHIYVLIGFFILLVYLLYAIMNDRFSFVIPAFKPKASRPADAGWIAGQARNDKERDLDSSAGMARYMIILILLLSTILISFSRSFWLGLLAGGIFVWLIAIFKLKIKLKAFVIYNSIILCVIIASLLLTAVAVKFPYPSAYGGFNPADLLAQRATQISGEAGASSRWQLLTPLWQEIKTAPIIGRGFGATVTYKSDDPRVLAVNPDGLYTTYSFEWGWLDLWLKLGLLGLIAYLFLLFRIIKDGLKANSSLIISLIAGVVVLMTVNIFSPYVNHPLGIGYIILTMAIIRNKESVKLKSQNAK